MISKKYDLYLSNSEQMELDAEAELAINLDDALQDIGKQPQLFMQWGQLAAIAEMQAEAIRKNLETVKAECRERARANVAAAGEKATEQRLDDLALLDPIYQKQLAIKRQADCFAARLQNIVFAFRQKNDMLIQVSARQRAELSTNIASESRSNDDELSYLKSRAREVFDR